ncbi:MAG: hypothetical protein KJ598_01515, partial [Nanoarchaeota archaeon]|nr:hypothetical protein [Nanoarchaeota archaeon]
LTNNVELTLSSVKVNGEDALGKVLAVEEGQTLDIKVGLVGSVDQNGDPDPSLDVENIQVEAEISGYEYSDYESLQDTTQLFDLASGTLKFVNLKVTLPTKLEKDTYWLRLRVMDKNTDAIVEKIELAVEPARHGLDIADVAFSPGNTVKAGKSLMATVLLENFGDKVEKDVKVTVEIPALGVSATEYVDVVPDDKDWDQDPNVAYEDVEEMVLMIPNTAKAGEYEVKVSARYDNMYETVTKTYTLNVLADKEFAAQDNNLILAVGPEGQNVAAGKTATYAVALTNAGSTSKAFAVGAAAGNWATSVSLSESLVVLEPGKNAVVYMEVAVAEDAAAGEHLVSLVVNSGNEDLKTVVLKANVVESKPAPVTGTSVSLRNGLEIALVVLVVLLVVIGLIVGFSRLRKDEEEEEQTYY